MKIINMRPVTTGTGKLRAFFSVDFENGVTVNDFRLVEGDKGMFCSPPQRAYEQDGQTRYANIVYVDKNLLDEIRRLALEVYNGETPQERKPPVQEYPRGPVEEDDDIPF